MWNLRVLQTVSCFSPFVPSPHSLFSLSPSFYRTCANIQTQTRFVSLLRCFLFFFLVTVRLFTTKPRFHGLQWVVVDVSILLCVSPPPPLSLSLSLSLLVVPWSQVTLCVWLLTSSLSEYVGAYVYVIALQVHILEGSGECMWSYLKRIPINPLP